LFYRNLSPLRFHTAWVIRDWRGTAADQAISAVPRLRPNFAMPPKIAICHEPKMAGDKKLFLPRD
jgi:hypothetical protein